MKKNLLNINSVLDNGIGGRQTGRFSLIYTYLLQQFGLDFYRHILINQIGVDLKEFVLIHQKKDVYINICYPNHPDLIAKHLKDENSIRLDIIHTALLQLAKEDERMDVTKLEAIRELIIAKEFSFDLVYKSILNKKNNEFVARIIIHPEEASFSFYVLLEQAGKERCKLLIYQGNPNDVYIDDLFYYGKWKGANEFIIKGKRSEIEFHIYVDKCEVELVNISANKNAAPIFNLFKATPPPGALQDFIQSLPPAIAAVLNYEAN